MSARPGPNDVALDDGKYIIQCDARGIPTAVLRNGEPWDRSVVGDKMLYLLVARIQELETFAKQVAQQSTAVHPEQAMEWQESVAARARTLINGDVQTIKPRSPRHRPTDDDPLAMVEDEVSHKPRKVGFRR